VSCALSLTFLLPCVEASHWGSDGLVADHFLWACALRQRSTSDIPSRVSRLWSCTSKDEGSNHQFQSHLPSSKTRTTQTWIEDGWLVTCTGFRKEDAWSLTRSSRRRIKDNYLQPAKNKNKKLWPVKENANHNQESKTIDYSQSANLQGKIWTLNHTTTLKLWDTN
jgi:hypothetical protein